MNMEDKGLFVAVLAVVVFGLMGALFTVNTINTEVKLRNQTEAQQIVLESQHDKLWKVLKQKSMVADRYRDTFTEIYPKLIAGRYDGSAGAKSFINVIREDNPDFSTDLYLELSRAIESHRESYFQEQKKLIDIHREHKNLLEVFPQRFILMSVEPIKIKTITSTRSKEALERGVEDDISL